MLSLVVKWMLIVHVCAFFIRIVYIVFVAEVRMKSDVKLRVQQISLNIIALDKQKFREWNVAHNKLLRLLLIVNVAVSSAKNVSLRKINSMNNFL